VPVAHNDLNKAYGKQAAHVYRSPGAYTVTCTVYAENRTLIGSDTFQITVNDPDAHFTGNRNILLKPDGQPEAAYPGAQVVTSVQAARDRVMQTAGACRILIPRGITITTTQTFQITNPATTNLYIASYGTGARPVLSIDANAIGANNGYGGDIVITGMQFNGPYDELTQTGATRIFLNVRDSPGGGRMNLIDDCIVDGYRHVYYPTGGYAENVWTMTVIHNSLSRNAGLYHLFADGNWENVAVLGCPFAHNPLAAATGATQDAKQNSQGTMRMTGRARVILSVCELFSKFGWGTGTYTEEQSCVRNNTSNRPEYMIICDRVVFESGWEVFNTGDNQSSNHEVNNILLEKCLLLGSSTTLTLIQVGNTGITVRNTIMVRPNSPYRDRSWDAFLAAHTDNFADPNSRLSCINCTFVQAQSAANHSGAPQATIWDANGKTFNTFENLNGVVYTPNNPSAQPFDPQFDALDLPVAGGGDFNPRYAGYRQRNEALQTQFATPDDAVKLWRPAVGSPLIGAATGVVAYDDYLGNVRPASASPGAVEAA
jgi:PKD repeat protein